MRVAFVLACTRRQLGRDGPQIYRSFAKFRTPSPHCLLMRVLNHEIRGQGSRCDSVGLLQGPHGRHATGGIDCEVLEQNWLELREEQGTEVVAATWQDLA